MGGINRRRAFSLMELKMTVFVIAALMVVTTFYVVNYVGEGRRYADRLKLEALNEALNRYKLLGGDIEGLTEGKPFAGLLAQLKSPIYKYGETHRFLRPSDTFSDAMTVDSSGAGDFYTLTRYNTYNRGGGSPILSGGEDATSNEFDTAGATYYAVAPAGYSYSSQQDAQYSTRKYNTLFAAEAALPANPTTPMVINILGSWASPDTVAVNFSGVATTSSNYILVRTVAEARHAGVWSDSAYRLVSSTTGIALAVTVAFAEIDGLQVQATNASATAIAEQYSTLGSQEVWFKNCIAVANGYRTFGTYGNNDGTPIVGYINCIAYGSSGIMFRISGRAAYAHYLYNCTAVGGSIGFDRAYGTATIVNCLAQGAANGFNGTFAAGSKNNASDIASDAPGSNPVTGTVSFVDEGANNYHLAPGDTVARGAGADMSTYYSTDIDGDTRTLPWSIGADQ